MSHALANLEKARLALMEARTLPEVKKIRDLAEAARVYARAAPKETDACNRSIRAAPNA